MPSTPLRTMSTSKGWPSGATPPTASPLINPRRRGSAYPIGSTTPSLSVPSLPTATQSASYLIGGGSPSSSTAHISGSTLPGYGLPKEFLSRILLLQACRSQLDLLRSLQDISTRLVLVPKPARLSSLRAELTVLNHGLPRGCSLGMSSKGFEPILPPPSIASATSSDKKKKKNQARIVRISPSESVVLNSADRAPFVIHVEVLEGDLDFDPDRRQNAEDLRRALQERENGVGGGARRPGSLESGRLEGKGVEMRRGASLGANHLPSSSSNSAASSSSGIAVVESDLGSKETVVVRHKREPSTPAEPREEMDLVEQLYGDVSIRDPIKEPEAEEEEIHNRSVDEQAWARRNDGNATSQDDSLAPPADQGSSSAPPSPDPSRPPSTGPPTTPATNVVQPGGRSIANRPAISLDDYAERMRMAAIMLAQLDASQTASLGVVATGTAAAGTLVGLPVATVAGIGGVVGAGLGAVASRLPFTRRDSQAGQASMGTRASLDTASAADGTSAVAGAPPPLPLVGTTSSPLSGASTGLPPPPPTQRPRLLSPTDAAAIRNRIMNEMMALEEERMARMREDGRTRSKWSAAGSGVEDGAVVMRAVNKDDPSGALLATTLSGGCRFLTVLVHLQAPSSPNRLPARLLVFAPLRPTVICPTGTSSP